ncbi:Cytochrome c551 peroxidase [hydrothermal vent metagenome]|uniref:Cytochrome c551 peroxidase n=1 Tax=hydrothermal vent metagenome TaxID=652676 RepID=A0A3B1BYI9_9ZZZZ
MIRPTAFFFSIILFSVTQAFGASPLLLDAKDHFEPLPDKPVFKPDNPGNAAKLELGKALYFDTRLSKSNVFSCNSCHNLAGGGVDNNPLSTGHGWNVGGRNAPTVLNASFHIAQFWDGRAKDVEAQAQGPVLAGVEMASTKDLVLKNLNSIPEYVALFAKAFPKDKKPLTYQNMANAIGAFERTLITPSRFDKFLKGDESALSSGEKEGLKLFIDKGCTNCHNEVAVGGGSYQKFGVENKPKFLKDKGRFEVTKDKDDMYVFKVPSLRNIELTYPYFNDGSVWELEEAVKIMGWTQLGEKLSDKEAGSLVEFLKSLTGKRLNITLPILPPSTASTPKPNRN